MKILGIDESGRGPVCGPLVMCGYLVDEMNLPKLKEIGVRDSKLLSAEKREKMFPLLRKIADDYVVLKVSAAEVDACSNLNVLEISKMQHIINLLDADKVVIDSPEVNTQKFSLKVRAGLKKKGTLIVAENFADKNHIEVGAASVMAKVERDMEIKKLHAKHGFFGSGYSHDEITIKFLKDCIKGNKEFPSFVRRSWLTAQRIKDEGQQKTIGKFVEKS